MTLTAKQNKFISEYLIDLNATQAAIRAGYSKNSARMVGYENLTKPYIQDVIQAALADAAARNNVTVDEITHYHREAFEVAKGQKQPSAMTAAAMNLAKLHGLITQQVSNTNAPAPVTSMQTVYVDRDENGNLLEKGRGEVTNFPLPSDINPDTGMPYNSKWKRSH